MIFNLLSLILPVALAAVLTQQTTPISQSCSNACAQLAAEFGDDLLSPGNGNNFTVWDAKQQEVQSACRVEPSTSADVAKIISVIVQDWCRFAVKGGGHARNADDSVSVGGVTIDLVKMKSIELSSDRLSAKLGAGHILYTLYSVLEPFNLSAIGGRVADVGFGGYTLGGGISNLSPKHGLGVDNVIEYEIVLANATIAKVNQHTNPDLYFALRGGMNNFGIVTHFTVNTFPLGQMFSGSRSFSAEQRDVLVDEAYKLTTEWKNDTSMAFSYGYAYNQAADKYTISFTEAYTEANPDPAPFKALNSLSYVSSTLRVDRMSNFSLEGASARPNGGRNLYASISYYPSTSLDKEIQNILMEEIQPIKNATGFSPNAIFQPLYEAAIRIGHERGGSALGIDAEGPLTMCLLTTQWMDFCDDQAMQDFAARFVARTTAATTSAGKAYRWMYINYANQQQDPFAGYGQVNLQRLKRIQASADPTGVFTSTGLCRGYFKLN